MYTVGEMHMSANEKILVELEELSEKIQRRTGKMTLIRQCILGDSDLLIPQTI